MLHIFVFGAFFSLQVQAASPAATSVDQRIQNIEKQLEEFEKKQTEFYIQLVERRGGVRTFLGESTSFGGFFESGMTAIAGPDMESQTSANSNILGINIASEFSGEMRFVSQFISGVSYPLQNPDNNPAVTPSHRQFGSFTFGALIAQGYFELTQSQVFNIQMGLGYVPFGHAFQQRELVLFRRRRGPQMINASGLRDVGIAFPLWMGVHVHGAFRFMEMRAGYNVYTFSPFSNAKTLGVGGRFWWASSERNTFGISAQSGRRSQEGSYTALGMDWTHQFESGGIVAEYARNTPSVDGPSVLSYYVEPYYSMAQGQWIVFVAADYLDYPENATMPPVSVPDPIQKWALGGGVNWVPLPFARFRLALFDHQYVGETSSVGSQQRRYYSVDLSGGIAF